MNRQLEDIVNAMFENTEMTEDAVALRDEILADAQEKLDDLIADHMDDNIALDAVVYDLSDMKKVIDTLPKKAGTAHAGPEVRTFAYGEIRRLHVDLAGGVGLTVQPGDGPEARVWFEGDDPKLIIREEAGQLDISMDAEDEAAPHTGLLAGLLRSLNIHAETIFLSSRVFVALPGGSADELSLRTRAGDIEVGGISARRVSVGSLSGDIGARIDGLTESVELSTKSGDVRLEAHAMNASAQSLSGDIEFSGSADALKMKTISGEVRVDTDGNTQHCELNSTSGDIDLRMEGCFRSISARSVSGDVCVSIPPAVGSVHTELSTVSGGTRVDVPTTPDAGAPAVRLRTVSGDIRVM